jgi:hypothetical protein
MLAVSEHAMEISLVVARAVVAVPLVLDEKPGPLAVLLSFVVLLAILDEPALPPVGGFFALTRADGIARLLGWPGMELLDDARARLGPMLTFGVILRTLLPARPSALGVWERLDLLTAVVFPLRHLPFLLGDVGVFDDRKRARPYLDARARWARLLAPLDDDALHDLRSPGAGRSDCDVHVILLRRKSALPVRIAPDRRIATGAARTTPVGDVRAFPVPQVRSAELIRPIAP